MSEYIGLENYADYLRIEQGDIILVSSDARKMIWDALSHHGDSDINVLIDGLIKAAGPEGTVLFPTYNWDFCEGTVFDIRTAPCMTGTMGTMALKRGDFIRTKHPIYSFAVHGKHAQDLADMVNTDSFGADSPFAFFKDNNVKNYIIDVDLQNSFTFVHYVEEQSGYVAHRYIKNFTAGYVDESGNESKRTYSMFVRDLELDVKTLINPIEPDFLNSGAEEIIKINSSEIKMIYLAKAYDIVLKDIVENKSRKLCTYKGQEE